MGEIWQIVFQTIFSKIKFGKLLSRVCPKLYNCFTNDASSAHTVPPVKLVEAVTPCSKAHLAPVNFVIFGLMSA